MNNIENTLKNIADEFLEKNYGLTLKIPIIIDDNLTNIGGQFIIYKNKPQAIKIKNVENSTDLLNILFHECVHYALYTLYKPYRDEDYYFKLELKRLNIPQKI